MATRKTTAPAPAGASSPISSQPPDLSDVQGEIHAEQNVARLLHRVAIDLRENLTIGEPVTDYMVADIDAMCSELHRLEQRLDALAASLDVPGGAEIVRVHLHAVAGQGAA